MASGVSLRDAALDAIGQTRWVPPTGENRIRGMVNAKPDWVMSRQRAWGVPIAVFVKKGEHAPLIDEAVNARIAAAFEQEGADAWYAEGAAARFLGNPSYDPARLRESRRHPRRLVRLRLDPRVRARRSRPFPRPRRHPPQKGRRRGPGDVSGRLRPASRLVPGLAAGKLRHARRRAVRHRADARLHARRQGPQAGQIARQPDFSAGDHQGLRRRHPAPLGRQHRLHRRSAHRPRHPQDGDRQLPQAAQFAALDAGHARPLQPQPHARVFDDRSRSTG